MTHRRFVLPRRDGSWLIDPPPSSWPDLLATNHAELDDNDYDCQGRSLTMLRDLTRKHVLQLATAYTSQLLGRNLPRPTADRWVVTGHQPELFHVGVWAKNFATHKLATATESLGLNLIVDQDTHAGMSIAVPTGTRLEPTTTSIPFDMPRPACPWEELSVSSREMFDSFPARARQLLADWSISPVLTDAWPLAKSYLDRVGPAARLADGLAAARVAMEHQWGAGNLELPMSRLSETAGFHWFVAHLLAQLPRFQPIHNLAVREYRLRHGLRSRTHPVPDLAVNEDWLEAPFWVWRRGATQRDRLFARQSGAEIQLRDRQGIFLTLPLTPDRSACCAVEQLTTLPALGIQLRSRALTTTLFARLFLADLFIHGIGGAKYDEITDQLIAQFFGMRVPGYATISATLHLPLGGMWPVSAETIGEVSQQLWQIDHQPERFLVDPPDQVQQLAAEKLQLAHQQREHAGVRRSERTRSSRLGNRQRYRRLLEMTRELRPAIASQRAELMRQRTRLLSLAQANRVLGSREFSWVLFPETRLQDFLMSAPLPDLNLA